MEIRALVMTFRVRKLALWISKSLALDHEKKRDRFMWIDWPVHCGSPSCSDDEVGNLITWHEVSQTATVSTRHSEYSCSGPCYEGKASRIHIVNPTRERFVQRWENCKPTTEKNFIHLPQSLQFVKIVRNKYVHFLAIWVKTCNIKNKMYEFLCVNCK